MTNSTAEARELLRQAHAFHDAGRIDDALTNARRATELDPGYADAWVYLGTTLITRRLAFADGLVALEHAVALAPDDPGAQYSLGWCYEFVAYRIEKQATRPYRDPVELYELAADHLRRCIELNPEVGLKEDAQDLLDSIIARL